MILYKNFSLNKQNVNPFCIHTLFAAPMAGFTTKMGFHSFTKRSQAHETLFIGSLNYLHNQKVFSFHFIASTLCYSACVLILHVLEKSHFVSFCLMHNVRQTFIMSNGVMANLSTPTLNLTYWEWVLKKSFTTHCSMTWLNPKKQVLKLFLQHWLFSFVLTGLGDYVHIIKTFESNIQHCSWKSRCNSVEESGPIIAISYDMDLYQHGDKVPALLNL